ncbi:Ionotropic receptor 201 [Frankliniella occidentalis]|nr:Ionotropic receptor 201 [Frankliniella occidentalis]
MQPLVLLVLLGAVCAGADASLTDTATTARPEAKCMASLLSSILPHNKTCLVLHGDTRLVGPLLWELDGELEERQVLLLDPRIIQSHLWFQMRDTTTVVVIAISSSAQLIEYMAQVKQFPSVSAIILWTLESSLKDVLMHATRGTVLWLCNWDVYIVVSAPDGTSSQFSPAQRRGCVATWESLNELTEKDQCAPSGRLESRPGNRNGGRLWERHQVRRLCSAWRPPPESKESEGSALTVISLKPAWKNPVVENLCHLVSNLTNVVNRQRPVELHWSTRSGKDIQEAVHNCNLSAAFLGFLAPVGLYQHIRYSTPYMVHVVVIVPAGLGQRLSLLEAVTDEFTVELWIATASSLLFMTAAIAVAWTSLGRPPLPALAAASLQTLAPLLGQSPPGATAHRPLTAVWLLMSVVIAAAYQGLLLRELTGPQAEINTLEQLEQSGLTIQMEDHLFLTPRFHPRPGLESRVRYFAQPRLYTALQNVAEGRNSAIICHTDVHLTNGPSKGLHTFMISGFSHLMSNIIFTTGSPLENPFRAVLGLSSNGGLAQHYFNLGARGMDVFTANSNDTSDQAHPLRLTQVQPAFLLLTTGYCISALVFALEVAFHKWVTHKESSAPVLPFVL